MSIGPNQSNGQLGQPQGFKEGGLVKEAQKVAGAGRYGDTMLVHMNPIEVKEMADKGELTINPQTGQPERFLPLLLGALGSAFGSSILGAGATSALAGVGLSASAVMSGVGSMAGSLIQGDSIEKAAGTGLLSFGMGSLMGGAADVPVAAGTDQAALAGMDIGGTGLESMGSLGGGAAPTAPYGLGAPSVPGSMSGFGAAGGPGAASIGGDLSAGVLPSNPAFMSATNPMSNVNPGILDKAAMGQAGVNNGAMSTSAIAAPGAGAGMEGILDRLGDPLTLGALAIGATQYGQPDDSPPKDYDIAESFPEGRQIVSPPPGFRPGIDPEISYFSPLAFAEGGEVGSGPGGKETLDGAGTMIKNLIFGGAPIPWVGDNIVSPILDPIMKPLGFGLDDEEEEGEGGQSLPTPRRIISAPSAHRPGFDPQHPSFAPLAFHEGGRVFAQGGAIPSRPQPPGAGQGLMPPMSAVGQRGGNRANPFASGINSFQSIDPRKDSKAKSALIQEAVMALSGKHPNPQPVITKFVTMFGPEALNALKQKLGQAGPQAGPRQGNFVQGGGTGMSDQIPARMDSGREARLSDGEFVIPADAVSGLGDGSSKAGSQKLQGMVDGIRKQKTGGTAQPRPLGGRVLPV